MNIVEAGVDDIPALLPLIHAAYRGEGSDRGWTTEADLLGGQRIDAEGLRALIEDPDTTVFKLEVDGQAAGCIEYRDEDGAAYFGMLAIDAAHQGAGLGSRMVDHVEQVARDAGHDRICMQVIRQRDDIIGWYERRGYRATGEFRAFPGHDPRFGLPKRDDLEFRLFEKRLGEFG